MDGKRGATAAGLLVALALAAGASPATLAVASGPAGATEPPGPPVWWTPVVHDSIPVDRGPSAARSVSPDGGWLAYAGDLDVVCVLQLTTGSTPDCQPVERFGFDSLGWSADSSRFVSGGDMRLIRPTDLVVVGVDGVTNTVEPADATGTGDPTSVIGAAFDDTGSQIVGIDAPFDPFPRPGGVVSLDATTGERRDVTTPPPGWRAWGPLLRAGPGRFVTVLADDGLEHEVLGMIDLSTGSATVESVTPDLEWAHRQVRAVSADGQTVLVVLLDRLVPNSADFYAPRFEVWDLATGSVLPLSGTADQLFTAATLSPDGEHVAVVRWDRDGALATPSVAVARTADLRAGVDAWATTPLDTDVVGVGLLDDNGPTLCWCGAGLVVAGSTAVLLVALEAGSTPPATDG